jgi:hypothetical protein
VVIKDLARKSWVDGPGPSGPGVAAGSGSSSSWRNHWSSLSPPPSARHRNRACLQRGPLIIRSSLPASAAGCGLKAAREAGAAPPPKCPPQHSRLPPPAGSAPFPVLAPPTQVSAGLPGSTLNGLPRGLGLGHWSRSEADMTGPRHGIPREMTTSAVWAAWFCVPTGSLLMRPPALLAQSSK